MAVLAKLKNKASLKYGYFSAKMSVNVIIVKHWEIHER